jgi:hypothetical protein
VTKGWTVLGEEIEEGRTATKTRRYRWRRGVMRTTCDNSVGRLSRGTELAMKQSLLEGLAD